MKNKTNKTIKASNNPKRQAFFEHIQELRTRLTWIALIFIVASAAAYPFYHDIMDILFAPLNGRELVYLTPIGGFSFIIKVCTYIGIIVAIPAIIYHGYRFLQPTMKRQPRAAKRFMTMSVVLALCGVAFAYYVLLPAALKFLTTLDIQQVTAMLTVDSYLNFVIAYLIGAAFLFQIPVILLLINNITRIPPGTMMKYQRHIVLGAFIVAAILSPTPDIVNQSLMAAPVVVMYQFAIVLVLLVNWRRKQKTVIKFTGGTYDIPKKQNLTNVFDHPETLLAGQIQKISKKSPERYKNPKLVSIDGYIRRPVAKPVNRSVSTNTTAKYQSIDGFVFNSQRQSA